MTRTLFLVAFLVGCKKQPVAATTEPVATLAPAPVTIPAAQIQQLQEIADKWSWL